MPASLADPLVVVLLSTFLKVSAVLGLAVIAHLVIGRRTSAAGRHFITTMATAMLLALPLASLVVPRLSLPVAPVEIAAAPSPIGMAAAAPVAVASIGVEPVRDTSGAPAEVAPTVRLSWTSVLLALYVAGVGVMGLHLAAQRWRVHRLGRDAQAMDDPVWQRLLLEGRDLLGVRRQVSLVRSRRPSMPMTFGTRHPRIVLPATADTWDDERRRAVLFHELAHVARLDCATQWGACVARAIYWCHPGVWWLASRMRLDREFACDDMVVAAGARPREYARHLLEIAYAFGGGHSPALAVTMARPSQLEGRLRALLDRTRARRGPSRRARLASSACACAVLLPLASVGGPARPIADAGGTAAVSASHADASTPAPLRIAPLTVAVVPPTPPHQQAPSSAPAAGGDAACTWDVTTATGETVHLRMKEGTSQSGRTVPIQQLDGLTAAQLQAGGSVRFALRRDAGTFEFDGTARGGAAGGVCRFTPSPTFGAELSRRGVTGLTPRDQYELARHDVGLAFVDELRTQKYATPSVADLVRAGQHGVHLEYLRGMGALGYALGSLAPLVTLRDHGVTPEYAREMASFGFGSLPADQLQRARDHGITPEYVRAMRSAGHGQATLEQLLQARDHGVTPEFAQELGAAGYTNLPLDQLVRVRDHGVTPAYVREMRQLGMTVALEDLVRARDHGVTTEYVRALRELGYASASLDTLVRMRDHGVTAAYVKELQTLGYSSLSPDDVVMLRDHGLTAERIGQINARAGTRLSPEALRSAAASGRAR